MACPMNCPGKFPKTLFVGAHQIENIANEDRLKTFLDTPNFYWGTSSTICLKGAIEKIVRLGGADKLLFGSDFPLNNMAIRLGSILGADISQEDMKKIIGGNVARLLKLDAC